MPVELTPSGPSVPRPRDEFIARYNAEFPHDNLMPCLCGAEPNSAPVIVSHDRYGLVCPVRRCRRCDLVYQSPRPTADYMAQFYASDAYRDFYDPPDTDYKSLYQATNHIAEVCRPLLPELPAVVEVGAGGGWNLFPFGDAVGVEPSPRMREFGLRHGVTMVKTLPARSFDLLISCHVIEHLFDPLAALKQWAERAPLIYLECPNIDNMRADQFVNVHLWYFNPRTLMRICNDAGLLPITTGAHKHHQWALLSRPISAATNPK